jgi:hypothetical protein
VADVDLLARGEQDVGGRVVADAVLVGPGGQVAVGGAAEAGVAVQGAAAVGAGVGQQLGDQEARVVGVADPRQQVGRRVAGEGALGLLQVGDEAVDRDDRLRPGQRGRLAPAPRPEARGGVAPAQPGRPPGRGPQGQGPAQRRAVGVDVVDGREEGADGRDLERGRGPGVAGDHQPQAGRGDRTVGQCQLGLLLHRSSPARDPTDRSGRRTRLGQACPSTLNQAIT